MSYEGDFNPILFRFYLKNISSLLTYSYDDVMYKFDIKIYKAVYYKL